MIKRGLLIVFAGNNGSGKTTIINEIIEKLNESNIESDTESKSNNKKYNLWNTFKYPNRNTVLGKKIDNFLKNKTNLSKELELKFFAENRKESQNEIINILNAGYNVICDRYTYCSLAYTLTNQTFSIKNGEKVDILSLDEILKYDMNLVKPDHVFLIRGDYLSLRNEVAEKYHKNDLYNELLLNNYIISFVYTKTYFTIINNILGDLDNSVNSIIKKIQHVDNNRNKYYIYDNYLQKF